MGEVMRKFSEVVIAVFCLVVLMVVDLPVLLAQEESATVPQFAERLCERECLSSGNEGVVELLVPHGDGNPIKIEFRLDEISIYVHQHEGTKAWKTTFYLDSARVSPPAKGYCTTGWTSSQPCYLERSEEPHNPISCSSIVGVLRYTSDPVYQVAKVGQRIQIKLVWTEVETYIKPTPPMILPPMPPQVAGTEVGKPETRCDCVRWLANNVASRDRFSSWGQVKEIIQIVVESEDFNMDPPAKK